MTTTPVAQDVPKRGRSMALWAGVIGAPMVWAVQLQVIYALGQWACGSERYVVLHVLSAVFLVLALVGAVLGWRDYRAAGEGSPDETDGGPVARTRFLGA